MFLQPITSPRLASGFAYDHLAFFAGLAQFLDDAYPVEMKLRKDGHWERRPAVVGNIRSSGHGGVALGTWPGSSHGGSLALGPLRASHSPSLPASL